MTPAPESDIKGQALAAFDAQLDDLFERACKQTGYTETDYCFGSLRLRTQVPTGIYQEFLRPMAFAAEPVAGEPDLTVRLLDSEGTGIPIPKATWPRQGYGRRCDIRSNDYMVEMRTWLAILHTYSLKRRLGYYWFLDAARLWWWESTFPLRQYLHWYGVHSAYQAAHAGAVGYPDGGVVIVGKSGSGKTTSTLACLDSDLGYAGDDYILMEEGEDTSWQVHALYDTAKLNAEDINRFSNLAPHCCNREKLPEQKAIFHIQDIWPERMIRSFPLKAILIPRVTGRPETTLSPAPPSAAMFALAPTSILQFAGGGRRAFEKFARLSRAIPAYYLNAGTTMAGIPAAIQHFLKTGTP